MYSSTDDSSLFSHASRSSNSSRASVRSNGMGLLFGHSSTVDSSMQSFKSVDSRHSYNSRASVRSTGRGFLFGHSSTADSILQSYDSDDSCGSYDSRASVRSTGRGLLFGHSSTVDSSLQSYDSGASCGSYDSRASVRSKDRELLLQQARLCEKGASRLKDVAAFVEASISNLQQVKTLVEGRQRQLAGFALALSNTDDNTVQNASAIPPSVKRVYQDSKIPTDAAMTQLKDSINKLMEKPAKVQNRSGPPQPQFHPFSAKPGSAPNVYHGNRAAAQVAGGPGSDACPICLRTIKQPKKLACGDTFCEACIGKAFATKPRCPKCLRIFCTLFGDQPKDGRMTHKVDNHITLPGYGPGAIVISYYIPAGIQEACHPKPGQRYAATHRTAYLPNNHEGNEVLLMLQKAFNQRLVFTIGDSATTGAKGGITWNDIHHKTSINGGRMYYGYPDPDYLRRVKEELAADGITSP